MKVHSVVVIGAGTMGAGIAQWFAQQMIPTVLCDNNSEQTKKALTQIHSSWDKLVEKEKLSACQVSQMKQLLEAREISALPNDTTLVIEAIVENLEVKKNLFATMDQHFSKDAIFASNTSSFPISLLAQAVSPDRQKRFIGLHFFNPATLMKLVEVIKTQVTEVSITDGLYTWFAEHRKEPALCADTPGFIVNRVARSFYGEALRIVENENEAHSKEVDFIMREVGGFKMGPFELMDLIGVDVNYSVTCSVWEALGKNARFTPHPLQKKMVDLGRFGKKTKHGFYSYE